MRASSGIYPALGRYFKKSQDMADAGCMSRTRLRDCLDGKKEFTDQEKSAICCRALFNICGNVRFTSTDRDNLEKGMKGDFDQIFKVSKEKALWLKST